MFVHRSEIPIEFAFSVFYILHNMGHAAHWVCLDRYKEHALEWIKSIYEDNAQPGLRYTPAEALWWQKQLSEPVLN